MSLNGRLKRIKEKFLASAPADSVATMNRATEALRESGILERLPAVGSKLPAFDLEDTGGGRVRSDELLSQGPLVLTFYRGGW